MDTEEGISQYVWVNKIEVEVKEKYPNNDKAAGKNEVTGYNLMSGRVKPDRLGLEVVINF